MDKNINFFPTEYFILNQDKMKRKELVFVRKGAPMNSYFPAGAASAAILSERLLFLLHQQEKPFVPPVILCIGTDRMIGDSLGPLVGTNLKKAGRMPFIYGTLQSPVHALNLRDTLLQIKKKHPGNTLIAVDASLGSMPHIGSVSVRDGGLRPGAGVNKNLCTAGDISITGVTNIEDGCPWLALQTARLSTVISMADCITDCIHRAAGYRTIPCP